MPPREHERYESVNQNANDRVPPCGSGNTFSGLVARGDGGATNVTWAGSLRRPRMGNRREIGRIGFDEQPIGGRAGRGTQFVRRLERDDAGEAEEGAEVEALALPRHRRRWKMVRRCLLGPQDVERVVPPRVWMTSGKVAFVGELDLRGEHVPLHGPGRVVVVVVQAALTDAGDDLWTVEQRNEIIDAVHRVVGVEADGRPDAVVRRRDGDRRRGACCVGAHRDHAVHTLRPGGGDHAVGAARSPSSSRWQWLSNHRRRTR